MKKIIFALIAVIGFAFNGMAQEVKKTTKTEKTAKVEKKTETKVVLKKDGTPDKRFTKQTETKVVLKKDGTPDKRYKK